MARAAGIVLAIAFVAYVSFVGGLVDWLAPAQAEEAMPAAAMDHPLNYRAVVCQSGHGTKMRCMFYMGRQ